MTTRGSVTEAQLMKVLEDSLEHADTVRVETLRAAGDRLAGRETAIRRERARKVAKYGADSPKTKQMDAALAHTARLRQDVTSAAQAADFELPEAEANAAVLHGRVLDQSRNPVGSAKVVAINQSGAVVATGQTDAKGYYKLTVPRAAGVPDSAVRLRVTDEKNNVLIDSKTDVKATPGTVQFRTVAIARKPTQPPATRPPSAKPPEPLQPSKPTEQKRPEAVERPEPVKAKQPPDIPLRPKTAPETPPRKGPKPKS